MKKFHKVIFTTAALLLGATSANALDDNWEETYTDNLRDYRYCEVLLIDGRFPILSGDVWGTQGMAGCDQQLWDNLDAKEIADDEDVRAVKLNGPRYFLMSAALIKEQAGAEPPNKFFGGIEMQYLANLSINLIQGVKPYQPRKVARNTTFYWEAGQDIFLLSDPEGNNFIMQSYSHIVDDTFTMQDLPNLLSDGKIQLPKGWNYASVTLTEPLEVSTVNGSTYVVQDDLENSYQFLNSSLDPEAGIAQKIKRKIRNKLLNWR